jgi:hypothetical protein
MALSTINKDIIFATVKLRILDEINTIPSLIPNVAGVKEARLDKTETEL